MGGEEEGREGRGWGGDGWEGKRGGGEGEGGGRGGGGVEEGGEGEGRMQEGGLRDISYCSSLIGLPSRVGDNPRRHPSIASPACFGRIVRPSAGGSGVSFIARRSKRSGDLPPYSKPKSTIAPLDDTASTL